jgi:hypothetical protein
MNILRGRTWHAGYHQYGNCWKFTFSVSRYATCTFYHFWRFYLSIDAPKPPATSHSPETAA